MHKTCKFNDYILDFRLISRSVINRRKEGTIITTLDENRFKLLEMLGSEDSKFEIGNLITTKDDLAMFLGKLKYTQLSPSAISEISNVVASIVEMQETKFIKYINVLGPLTPRIHSLELIPGIGKTYMKAMFEERAIKEFASYKDMQERVELYDSVKHITERIVCELAGNGNFKLFVLQ